MAPYIHLLGNPVSLRTYFVVLLEGIFIVGTFSYLGAYFFSVYTVGLAVLLSLALVMVQTDISDIKMAQKKA